MISVKDKGDFKNTENFLKIISKGSPKTLKIMEKYGRKGVEALSSATPVKTGKTASSWEYKIDKKNGSYALSWNNTNIVNGVPIAVILNYGHSTSQGVYVQGKKYIEPVLQPIINKLVEELWKEVVGK